jgi:tRNA pseudouridine55 synthase
MESGLILFNKQPGVTSFDALRCIKRALGTGKAGHTGILDKFAGGLLLVLTGKALKLSRWFSHCDKKYSGKICFGEETDTLDPEGNVIARSSLPSREDVEKVLCRFTGEILQEPPVFSAIHVNGKRASSLARSGKPPVMKKREVSVYKLELLSWQPPFAEIFVHCSGGTYIRSLARVIALAAGSRGHLKSLLRTQAAGFNLEESRTESDIMNEKPVQVLQINKNIISKLGLPWFDVTQEEAQAVFHGKPLEKLINKYISCAPSRPGVNVFADQSTAVFYRETLAAIIEKINDKWTYGCVAAYE